MCPECNKKFMRSDHLSKHIKTHQKGAASRINVATSSTDVDLDSIMLTTAGEADQSALQTGTSSGGITIGMADDFDDSDDESGSDLSDSEISAAGVSGTTSGIPGGQLKT